MPTSPKAFRFALLVVVGFFASLNLTAVQQDNLSPEFRRFLQTVEAVYCRPNNLDFNVLIRTMPTTTALLIGNALRHQIQHMGASDPSGEKFADLQMDALFFMDEVCQAARFRDEHGNTLNADQLRQQMKDAVQGKGEDFFASKYKVSGRTMPNVLGPAVAGPAGRQPQAKLEDEDSVELLDVVPDPEPSFEAEPTGAGRIVGLWQAKIEKFHLAYGYEWERKDPNPHLFFDVQVSRSGPGYSARVVGTPPDRTYWIGRELFRVKFDKDRRSAYDFIGEAQSIPVKGEKGIWVPTGPPRWISGARVEYFPVNDSRTRDNITFSPEPGNSRGQIFVLFRPGAQPRTLIANPFMF
jgi:hypothetical protein